MMSMSTISFVSDEHLQDQHQQECIICTMNKSEFITFQCKHKCCKDCYTKINKCHMCRYVFKKCKIMKTTVTLKSLGGTMLNNPITLPFHFDAISREVGDELFGRNSAIMLHELTLQGIDVTKCVLNDFTIDNDNIEIDEYFMNKIADDMGIIRNGVNIQMAVDDEEAFAFADVCGIPEADIVNFMRICCEIRYIKVNYKDDELLTRIKDGILY